MPDTVATELWLLQTDIKRMQEHEARLKSKLLANLKAQHVKSVRLEDGTSFTIAERQTLKVTDSEPAVLWAEDNYCMKIDGARALKILRRSLKKLPKFFKIESTQYLTVRRAGAKEVEEE